MSDSLERLRSKIGRARQLGSVVHAMKALASLRIGQFEEAVRSLDEYMQNVELGLSVSLRSGPALPDVETRALDVAAIVFGSDQGLVGRFNETMMEYTESVLGTRNAAPHLWVVGERLAGLFDEHGRPPAETLAVPGSLGAVAPLVARLLAEVESYRESRPGVLVYLLFNRFEGGASYAPAHERLLPFDAQWQGRFSRSGWPTRNIPQPFGETERLLGALLQEYLFGSLFRACAESISSENASRLAAMQRAQRNIDSLAESLTLAYNGLRQSAIDEELFDVVAGFEAVGTS